MKAKRFFCEKSVHNKQVIIDGFIPLKINKSILKSETAAVAIAAILKKENLS